MLERTWGARGLGERVYRPVAAGRLTAVGSSASKLTAKLLAINPGWLLYPMGSVTTGRVRPAEQLGVELPVPIRVTEYRLRHGHSQTDGRWRDASSRQWDACRPTRGRFVVTAPDATPRSGSSRAPVVVGNLGYDVRSCGRFGRPPSRCHGGGWTTGRAAPRRRRSG